MTVETNKALLRRFVEEIVNQGNVTIAAELVAEDFRELDPFPGQAPVRGRQAQKKPTRDERSEPAPAVRRHAGGRAGKEDMRLRAERNAFPMRETPSS